MQNMRLKSTLIVTGLIVLATPILSCAQQIDLPQGIAFFAEHEGGLHVLHPSSGQLEGIDVGFRGVRDLAYSDKTQLLAFTAARRHGEKPSLYLLKPGGSAPRLIFQSDEESYLIRPTFDPSGEALYALNYFMGIYRYDFTSEKWQPVKVTGADSLNPQGLSFSRSGNSVAVSPARFKGFLIGKVTENGIKITKHVLSDFQSCISPRWVDESRIVFAGRQIPGSQYLWSFNIDTGRLSQITKIPIASRDFLDLSADRTSIVFTATDTRKPTEWRLWQVNIDGSRVEQLTSAGKLSSHLGPVHIH